MSWAGALGGLGRSVQSLANKYIDEELAQNRAKFLQDLQLQGERQREEYQQSPEVQGRRNRNAATAALSAAEAQRQTVVAGANDGNYQSALDQASQRDALRKGQATATQLGVETPAKVASANQVEAGTRDERVRTQRELTQVQTDGQLRVVGAQKAVSDPLAKIKPADRERLAGISAELKRIDEELVKAKAADGGWSPDKNPGQQELLERRQMLAMRQEAILSKYEEGGISDPLGIRGGPPPAPKPEPQKPAAPPRIEGGEQRSTAPSLWDRAMTKLSDLGKDYSTPEAKAELRQRVADAQRGGRPLSRTEELRWQQMQSGVL